MLRQYWHGSTGLFEYLVLYVLLGQTMFEQLGLFSWWLHLCWYCYYPCKRSTPNGGMHSIYLIRIIDMSWHCLNCMLHTISWSKDWILSLLVIMLDSITFDLISSCSWVFAVWIVYTIFVIGFVTPPNGFGTQLNRENLAAELVLQSLVCCAWAFWQLKLRPYDWLGGHESEGKMRVEKSQCFAVLMLYAEA